MLIKIVGGWYQFVRFGTEWIICIYREQRIRHKYVWGTVCETNGRKGGSADQI